MDQTLRQMRQPEFELLIKNSQDLSLVEFGAPWCPPCKALVPTLLSIEHEYGHKLKVYTINVDESAELAAKYEIRGLPTVLLFHKGKPIDRLYGKQSIDAYRSAVNKGLVT